MRLSSNADNKLARETKQGLKSQVGDKLSKIAEFMEPGSLVWDRLDNGAPPLAPLLLPNLVGLALIGFGALLTGRHVRLGASSNRKVCERVNAPRSFLAVDNSQAAF